MKADKPILHCFEVATLVTIRTMHTIKNFLQNKGLLFKMLSFPISLFSKLDYFATHDFFFFLEGGETWLRCSWHYLLLVRYWFITTVTNSHFKFKPHEWYGRALWAAFAAHCFPTFPAMMLKRSTQELAWRNESHPYAPTSFITDLAQGI